MSSVETEDETVSLEKQRKTAETWLRFVHDFGRLDVSPLLAQLSCPTFVSTLTSLIKIGGVDKTPWESFEAIRDYCVISLPHASRTDSESRTANASPYAVPVELLQGIFIPKHHRHQFPWDPSRLRVFHSGGVIDVGYYTRPAAEAIRCPVQSHPIVLTTIHARTLPADVLPQRTDVTITDEGAQRVQTVQLWALLTSPQPLFMPIAPHSSIRIEIRSDERSEATTPEKIFLLLSGWQYLLI